MSGFMWIARVLAAWLVFGAILPCKAIKARQLTLSPDQQYHFAQHLYQNGQYLRAAEEYQRFAFFFSQDPRKPDALYLAGDAFFQSRAYDTALRVFKDLSQSTPLDQTGIKAYFMTVECYLKMGTPSQALVQLHNLITLSDAPAVRDRAYFRMGWIHIEYADWTAAKRAFERISPGSELPVAQLVSALDQSELIPMKSPALAGTLSIVPGAGQLYCGRYQDALAAFLINVGLIWAAVDAFDQEQYALGGLLSFVGAGFYTGNIYGAVSSAHKYNHRQKQQYIQGLKQRISFKLEPAPHGSATGLCLSLCLHY